MDRKAYRLLPLAPALALFIIFFIIPSVDSIVSSMHTNDGTFVGLDQYVTVFSSPEFGTVFSNTLMVAICSTTIAMILSIVFSLALRGTFIGKRMSLFMFQLNSAFPHMSVAIMMVFLLATWGYISTICYNIGVIENFFDFPKLVKGDSWIGTIISFSWKFAPFIGLSIISVLQSTSAEYEAQAATLGVGPLKRFVQITLPTIMPALVSTSLICFAYAFGSYEVPSMLSNNSTMATYAYNRFNDPVYADISNQSYVYCNIILLVSAIASILYLIVSIPKKKRMVN